MALNVKQYDRIEISMKDLGFTTCMGPQLRATVEKLLLADLEYYGYKFQIPEFDWSCSCPEGHRTHLLDGDIENWSGVAVVDLSTEVSAYGWIDFIHVPKKQIFIVYWDLLTIDDGLQKVKRKKDFGIPQHVWDQLPDEVHLQLKKSKYYRFEFQKRILP